MERAQRFDLSSLPGWHGLLGIAVAIVGAADRAGKTGAKAPLLPIQFSAAWDLAYRRARGLRRGADGRRWWRSCRCICRWSEARLPAHSGFLLMPLTLGVAVGSFFMRPHDRATRQHRDHALDWPRR